MSPFQKCLKKKNVIYLTNKYFNHFPLVTSIEGATFTISRVNRLHMGAYLCIASNGVPPSVSKRVMLIVHCKYKLKIIFLFSFHFIYIFVYYHDFRYFCGRRNQFVAKQAFA